MNRSLAGSPQTRCTRNVWRSESPNARNGNRNRTREGSHHFLGPPDDFRATPTPPPTQIMHQLHELMSRRPPLLPLPFPRSHLNDYWRRQTRRKSSCAANDKLESSGSRARRGERGVREVMIWPALAAESRLNREGDRRSPEANHDRGRRPYIC